MDLIGEQNEQLEQYSIPLQLQRLFAALCLSDQHSVSTVELTRSFGWRAQDVGQQQDVQELLHVLFDALSDRCKGTKIDSVPLLISLLWVVPILSLNLCSLPPVRAVLRHAMPSAGDSRPLCDVDGVRRVSDVQKPPLSPRAVSRHPARGQRWHPLPSRCTPILAAPFNPLICRFVF
jgi:hypothetical protein